MLGGEGGATEAYSEYAAGRSRLSQRRRWGVFIGLLAFQAWVEEVAERVAHEVERQHGEHDGQPGERGDPGAAFDVLPALAEDVAPAGRGGRDAEAEERQARLGADGRRDVERADHDEGVEGVREHVTRHEPELSAAQRAGGQAVVLLTDGEREAPG